jgi:hypothetical protein
LSLFAENVPLTNLAFGAADSASEHRHKIFTFKPKQLRGLVELQDEETDQSSAPHNSLILRKNRQRFWISRPDRRKFTHL